MRGISTSPASYSLDLRLLRFVFLLVFFSTCLLMDMLCWSAVKTLQKAVSNQSYVSVNRGVSRDCLYKAFAAECLWWLMTVVDCRTKGRDRSREERGELAPSPYPVARFACVRNPDKKTWPLAKLFMKWAADVDACGCLQIFLSAIFFNYERQEKLPTVRDCTVTQAVDQLPYTLLQHVIFYRIPQRWCCCRTLHFSF